MKELWKKLKAWNSRTQEYNRWKHIIGGGILWGLSLALYSIMFDFLWTIAFSYITVVVIAVLWEVAQELFNFGNMDIEDILDTQYIAVIGLFTILIVRIYQ